MPVERAGQEAAEQHADTSTASRDEPVDAHRPGAFCWLGEQVHDQGERHCRDNGTAEPLDAPCRDKELLGGGQAAGERCQCEERDTDQEESPVAEEVAQSAAEQEETTESEQISIHDPGEGGLRESKIDPDRWQRDIYNR